MAIPDDRRWPKSLYSNGTEPDPRFSLANERTALAWIRTASSIVAGGIALAVYASSGPGRGWVSYLAVAACLAGAGVGLTSFFRWMRVERALRTEQPMPSPGFLLFVLLVLIPLLIVLAGLALGDFGDFGA